MCVASKLIEDRILLQRILSCKLFLFERCLWWDRDQVHVYWLDSVSYIVSYLSSTIIHSSSSMFVFFPILLYSNISLLSLFVFVDKEYICVVCKWYRPVFFWNCGQITAIGKKKEWSQYRPLGFAVWYHFFSILFRYMIRIVFVHSGNLLTTLLLLPWFHIHHIFPSASYGSPHQILY